MFTIEPPFNSQNDRVYTPIDNKKRYIDPSRLLCMVMVSVAVSQVGMTEPIFVNFAVKVNGQYYCNVLLSQQMLPAIKRVAVSQNVVYSHNMLLTAKLVIFVCSVISQGKVVALGR